MKASTNLFMIFKNLLNYFFVLLIFGFYACSTKKSKSDIEIEFVKDTLTIGYTYWWAESGPFIGQCGDELSLVFSGTVTDLQQSSNVAGPLYNSQKGTIEINEVYKIKDLADNHYANQKFITTDCFEGLDLNVGDKVLVSCYDFEDNYTLPGDKSILKISNFDNPLIASIRRYIDTNQNALQLKKDVSLWAEEGLGVKLEEIIKFAEERNSKIPSNSIHNQ